MPEDSVFADLPEEGVIGLINRTVEGISVCREILHNAGSNIAVLLLMDNMSHARITTGETYSPYVCKHL